MAKWNLVNSNERRESKRARGVWGRRRRRGGGAQRGLLLQHWCSISRAGHSGDWQDMQSLLIFGTFYMHGSASTPDQGGEMLLIKLTIRLQIISGGVLLIEKKIVSTDGGGGCIRRGNGCFWGWLGAGGAGLQHLLPSSWIHQGNQHSSVNWSGLFREQRERKQRPENPDMRHCDIRHCAEHILIKRMQAGNKTSINLSKTVLKSD